MWQKINKRCFSIDTARIDSSRLLFNNLSVCVRLKNIKKSVSFSRERKNKKSFLKKIILVPYRDICFILRNINSYIKVVVIVDFTKYVDDEEEGARWEKHTRTQFVRKVCFLFFALPAACAPRNRETRCMFSINLFFFNHISLFISVAG